MEKSYINPNPPIKGETIEINLEGESDEEIFVPKACVRIDSSVEKEEDCFNVSFLHMHLTQGNFKYTKQFLFPGIPE
jgi:hypothetical protein